jgi:hypothetical protein
MDHLISPRAKDSVNNECEKSRGFARLVFEWLYPRKSVADFPAPMHESAPYKISSVHNSFCTKVADPESLTPDPIRP